LCFRKFHLADFYSLLHYLAPSKVSMPLTDQEMLDFVVIMMSFPHAMGQVGSQW